MNVLNVSELYTKNCQNDKFYVKYNLSPFLKKIVKNRKLYRVSENKSEDSNLRKSS